MIVNERRKPASEPTIIRREYGYKGMGGIGVDRNGNWLISNDWDTLVQTAVNGTRIIELPDVANALSSPRKVFFDPTHTCQLSCSFCLSGSNTGHSRMQLSEQRIQVVLQELVSSGVLKVKLGGGEPLLMRRLPDIVEYLSLNGVFVSLSTSGSVFEQENLAKFAEMFRKYRVKVSLSLDGHQGFHDRLRGTSGLYEKVVWALQRLQEQGCSVELRTTLLDNPESIDALKHMIDLAKTNSIYTRIRFAKPVGSAAVMGNAFVYPNSAYWALYNELRKHQYRTDLLSMDEMVYFDASADSLSIAAGMDCAAGTRSAFIDQGGNLSPCGFIEEFFGSEAMTGPGESLLNQWAHGESFLRIREHHFRSEQSHPCTTCAFVHSCQGGCPLIRLTANEDVDPRCPKEREVYSFTSKSVPLKLTTGTIFLTEDRDDLIIVGEYREREFLCGTPGGRMDGLADGGDFVQAVRRETNEELGLVAGQFTVYENRSRKETLFHNASSSVTFDQIDVDAIANGRFPSVAILSEHKGRNSLIFVYLAVAHVPIPKLQTEHLVLRVPLRQIQRLADSNTTMETLNDVPGVQIISEFPIGTRSARLKPIGTLRWLIEASVEDLSSVLRRGSVPPN